VEKNAGPPSASDTAAPGKQVSNTAYLELQINRIIQSGVLSRVTCQKRLCHAVFGHIDSE